MPDSLDPGFTTEEMSLLWSNAARVATMARLEAALARAQASCGVIEAGVADEIERACARIRVDGDEVLAAGWEVGSPVIVLLDRLRESLRPEAAAAIHRGATTQDITDTCAVIQIRDSLSVMRDGLDRLGGTLAALADRHRGTAMIGRTFRQHALPTTFGLGCARWLAAVADDLVHLRDVGAMLPVQLGGAVGTAAGLGPDPVGVLEAFAAECALVAPTLAWHADRTPIRRAVAAAAGVAATAARIGSDLVDLAQTEVGEVSVRAGGSSAVPGKRNPIDAIRAVAAEQVCTAAASGLRPHSLERAAGPWHAEWALLPIVFQSAGAALEAINRAIESLEVHVDAMSARVPEGPDPTTLEAAAVFVDRALDRWRQVHG